MCVRGFRLLDSSERFKKCFFLIKSHDGTVTHCLKFKLWNEPCPPRCDQYTPGEVGNMEEVEDKKYDVDCRDFTRISQRQNQPAYYCTMFMLPEPLCEPCLYHRYFPDLFNEVK